MHPQSTPTLPPFPGQPLVDNAAGRRSASKRPAQSQLLREHPSAVEHLAHLLGETSPEQLIGLLQLSERVGQLETAMSATQERQGLMADDLTSLTSRVDRIQQDVLDALVNMENELSRMKNAKRIVVFGLNARLGTPQRDLLKENGPVHQFLLACFGTDIEPINIKVAFANKGNVVVLEPADFDVLARIMAKDVGPNGKLLDAAGEHETRFSVKFSKTYLDRKLGHIRWLVNNGRSTEAYTLLTSLRDERNAPPDSRWESWFAPRRETRNNPYDRLLAQAADAGAMQADNPPSAARRNPCPAPHADRHGHAASASELQPPGLGPASSAPAPAPRELHRAAHAARPGAGGQPTNSNHRGPRPGNGVGQRQVQKPTNTHHGSDNHRLYASVPIGSIVRDHAPVPAHLPRSTATPPSRRPPPPPPAGRPHIHVGSFSASAGSQSLSLAGSASSLSGASGLSGSRMAGPELSRPVAARRVLSPVRSVQSSLLGTPPVRSLLHLLSQHPILSTLQSDTVSSLSGPTETTVVQKAVLSSRPLPLSNPRYPASTGMAPSAAPAELSYYPTNAAPSSAYPLLGSTYRIDATGGVPGIVPHANRWQALAGSH